MFIILYYDVNAKRCGKMLKVCRAFLQWVQNSVFEGEISEANYQKLVIKLEKIINRKDGDSVVIYKFRELKYYKREVLGIDKKADIQFI